MAVIRCQACGKPNPDFLENCQYCEAPLEPAASIAPLTSADDTVVARPASPPPADSDDTSQAGTIRERLRTMSAAGDDAAESPADSEPPSGDWMSRLRGAQDAEVPPADREAAEPDWMWGTEPSGEPAEPAADAEDTFVAPPASARGGLPSVSDSDVPDWLQDPNAAPLPDVGAPSGKPRRKMTDWLNAQSGAEPAEPLEVDDLPEWLQNMGDSGADADLAADTLPPEGLPDWLRNLREGGADAPEPAASGPRREQELPSRMRPDERSLPAQRDSLPDEHDTTPEAAPPLPVPTSTQRLQAQPAWLRSGAQDDTPPAEPPASTPPSPPPSPPPADATIPSPKAAAPQGQDMPEWLRDIITPGEESAAPLPPVSPEAPLKKKMTDWLGATQARSDEPAPIDPDTLVPDWLQNMSAGEPAPPAETPAAALPQELPDWLRTVAGESEPTTPAASAEDTAAPPPAQPPAAAPAAELPDWLAALAPSGAVPPPSASVGDDGLSWLDELSEPEAEAAALPETPVAAAPPAEPDADETAEIDLGPAAAAPPAEAPDWMEELAAASQAAPAEAAPEAAAPDIQPTPESEMPGWLRSLRGMPASEPADEDVPDWLRALRGMPPQGEVESLPDLPDLTPPPAEPVPSTADDTAALAAPAALPAWLAAMRPVDIERPATPVVDTYQETLGVLSGMRGVLRAEPAVSHLQMVAAPLRRLEVSETNNAHLQLLAELAPAEAAAPPRRATAAKLSGLVERWVIFGLLAVAILLTQFQFPGMFAPPSRVTEDAHNAYLAVASLAEQSGLPGAQPRPVLVALDYEAGQQGELNPAVRAILSQVLTQGSPVIVVSTWPEGAAVAQAVLSDTARTLTAEAPGGFAYGEQYVNLGYLPGGPVGLLQFASSPRSAFAADFTGQLADVWAAPAAARVERFEDFGLVVVAAGSAQSLRGWVEQTHLHAPGAPLVAVVSAGADPMVRPYLMGTPPQLAGLVSGLAGAAQYENRIGRPADATALWPAMGGGLWMAVAIIVAGNVVFGALALTRRRRR